MPTPEAQATMHAKLQESLKRRQDAEPPCAGCGGPHRFDTSIASPLWNRVIRAAGLPEYLCTSCIVLAFARAGEGFQAELYGDAVDAPGIVPVISVQVGQRPIEDSYGDLQAKLEKAEADAAANLAVIKRVRSSCALKPHQHFSFGPQRYYEAMDECLSGQAGTALLARLRELEAENERLKADLAAAIGSCGVCNGGAFHT